MKKSGSCAFLWSKPDLMCGKFRAAGFVGFGDGFGECIGCSEAMWPGMTWSFLGYIRN